MKIKKSIPSLLAVTAALTFGMSAGVGTTPASAASNCGGIWSVRNNSSAIERVIDPSAPIKEYPFGECRTVETLDDGAIFYAWCFTHNKYGNIWIYGRSAKTDRMGYVFDDHLIGTNHGSLNLCTE
ncbi:hypothetical protein ABII15_08265 [Streptomyces sp. HUAS MG91]|uniref:SH3 domain-containing protein n=1 Tax=Streptomyces tabacisoli TaxID=3156398 RepID=A0AAU8INP4_9ACTN